MVDPSNFLPDQSSVAVSLDGKYVRLLFENDDGDFRSIVIAREVLPILCGQIHKCIEPYQMAPIATESMRPGAVWNVLGFAVESHPNGVRVLALHVDFGDGSGTSIPFPINPKDREMLLSSLAD